MANEFTEQELIKELELIKEDLYFHKLELKQETQIIVLLDKAYAILEKIRMLLEKHGKSTGYSDRNKYGSLRNTLDYFVISDVERLIRDLKLHLKKDENAILILDKEDRQKEKILQFFRRDVKLARIPNPKKHGLYHSKRLNLEKKHEEMIFYAFHRFSEMERTLSNVRVYVGYSHPIYGILNHLSTLFNELRSLALKELKIMKSEKLRY